MAYLLPAMVHCEQHEPIVANGPIVVVLAHDSSRIDVINREFEKFAFNSVRDAVCLHHNLSDQELRDTMATIAWQERKFLISHPKALERVIGLNLMTLNEVSFFVIEEGE